MVTLNETVSFLFEVFGVSDVGKEDRFPAPRLAVSFPRARASVTYSTDVDLQYTNTRSPDRSEHARWLASFKHCAAKSFESVASGQLRTDNLWFIYRQIIPTTSVLNRKYTLLPLRPLRPFNTQPQRNTRHQNSQFRLSETRLKYCFR